MSKDKNGVTRKEVGGSSDRFWNPRFWDGMTMSAWFRAASKGRWHITPSRWGMAAIISGLSVLNSSLAFAQKIFYDRRIRKTELKSPPVFIIGHWRSGTTLLHEYMIRDPQFTFSDTYICFAPAHFLVSGWFFRPWVQLLMPKKRPMDNMAVGLSRPQEDEFALCAYGLPSPYLNMLYPNEPPIDSEYLTLRDISPEQRKHWLDVFEYFMKSLTVASNKTVILKSPPHTARIRTILERFPDARFVHIHRDPFTLFPSTHTLWTRLAQTHGAQHPKGLGLEEKILSDFEKMYAAFDEDVPLLKKNQFLDVSYDELVQTPVDVLQRIYHELELDGFDQVQPVFAQYAETQKSYKKNRFQISPEIEEQIRSRWSRYIERYHY